MLKKISLLICLLTACKDSPTGIIRQKPEAENKIGSGMRISAILEDSGGGGGGGGSGQPSYTEEYAYPPQYSVTNETPAQWCEAQRTANNQYWTADQKQRLVWDDYSIVQNPPVRQYSGVVLSGRFRVTYRGFIGTYSGQPIQCVRIESFAYNKVRNYPRTFFQESDPATEFWIGPQDNNWGFCFGSACSTEGANLHVQVKAIFKRKCNIDVFISNCMQDIQNGQLVWEIPNTGYLSTGQWDVQVFASGYWTAWNYGGNPISGSNDPNDLGYWQYAESGYSLLNSYHYTTSSGYAANAAGQTSWKCCSPTL